MPKKCKHVTDGERDQEGNSSQHPKKASSDDTQKLGSLISKHNEVKDQCNIILGN